MKPVNVLIVDDSELIRALLSSILSSDPHIHVVGTAGDPYEAREKIKQLNPDVITLDVEMPKMDGITFLKNLMRLRPIPVIMVSTLTEKGAQITMEAMAIGAVDFVAKPKADLSNNLNAMGGIICAKVKQAARIRLGAMDLKGPSEGADYRELDRKNFKANKLDLILLGASTGGTIAINKVLSSLPAIMPPIAIVQHMPEKFTASFAERLDRFSQLNVVEADNANSPMQAGTVYLARGGEHLRVVERKGQLLIQLDDSEPVNRHKPSVDVLFSSAAALRGAKIVAALLTGMGADGANGMGQLKDSGAVTIAQDEASSIVWGMPRVAVETGVVDRVLPLNKIAEFLVQACYKL